ncbi:MAG: YIP1 family protein [Candidatus Methanoperedens sp.]|jgi:hypothetical protein|nr:YIP1 family protein [Candidatus Methanoperedens sp.]PKL53413.1 MAG: hypothetical protein CVV36_07310 [Candidatus Methanoperedenaceae archaeon HGW-Methanoperedenaceae-1]
MFAILDYLKKWFETAKLVIKTPRVFFREMPVTGSLKEPVSFAFVTILVISLLYAPLLLLSWSRYLPIGKEMYYIILGLAGLFVYSIVSTSISLPVNAIISHILLLVLGAKGDLKATIRVFCYFLAVSQVIIPIATIIVLVLQIVETPELDGILYQGIILFIMLGVLIPVGYAYYVLLVGLSEVHNISMKRVLLALIGIPVGIFILLVAFAMVLVFFTGFSNSMGTYPPSPVKYTPDVYEQPYPSDIDNLKLTAPYGSAPNVDGYYTPEDKWDDTQVIAFISRNINYSIAAKHDGENLYLLAKWKGQPEELDYVLISFEQDGNSHDHNLNTGRNDQKITDPERYGINHFADIYYPEQMLGQESVINLESQENGKVRSNYIDGFWIQEWVVPLRSGDFGDLYLNDFPATLGFMLINKNVKDGESWPPDLNPYDLKTWGDIEILGSDELMYTPEITTLTASRGTAPVIDGFYKPEDGWEKTQQVYFTSNNIDFTIAAKHDNMNLYTLIKWESVPEWNGVIGLIYEQDGDSHDHNLMTGRNITMIFLEDDVPQDFGITPYGDAKVNYIDGVRVMESYIPLKNNNPENINYLYVNQTPATLGFTIFMPWNNNNIASWPVSSDGPYKPETWGNLMILP